MKRISGGQLSREAKPRFYQVTPAVLGRRRATQALPVRPKQSTQQSRVSPPPARGPTGRVGRHRPDAHHSDSDSGPMPYGSSSAAGDIGVARDRLADHRGNAAVRRTRRDEWSSSNATTRTPVSPVLAFLAKHQRCPSVAGASFWANAEVSRRRPAGCLTSGSSWERTRAGAASRFRFNPGLGKRSQATWWLPAAPPVVFRAQLDRRRRSRPRGRRGFRSRGMAGLREDQHRWPGRPTMAGDARLADGGRVRGTRARPAWPIASELSSGNSMSSHHRAPEQDRRRNPSSPTAKR